MDNLGSLLAKGGDRTKMLYNVFHEYGYDSNVNSIDRRIRKKFKIEKVNVKEYYDYYMETCNSFMHSVREIVNTMINGSTFDIEDYIAKIGKQQVFE